MTAPRTAVVTGASSGIGRATAAALAARGLRVVGTSREPDRIPAAERLPGVEYAALDLTDPSSVEALAGHLAEADVLVNNAGESQSGALEDLPPDAVERLFRVNVLAPVRLTQLALPGMRARGRGRVVMIGSMLASFPLAYRSSYVATKAAIRGFSDAARLETAPFGVHVTTVEPGSVSTGIGTRRTTYVPGGSPYADDVRTMLGVLDRNEAAGIPAETVARTVLAAIDADPPRPLYAVGSGAPRVFALKRLLPHAVVLRTVARRHGLRR